MSEIVLRAKRIPHSSIVGGGLQLIAPDGSAAFIVNFMGTTRGITPEETEALVSQFEDFVRMYGISVPERKP